MVSPDRTLVAIQVYTMFGPKKQVSGFSYTPAILHDLHENKLFYMKTSFLQENKVSDFHIHLSRSLPIKMYGICQVSDFSYTPAVLQNLHEKQAFYKVSDSLRIRKRGGDPE